MIPVLVAACICTPTLYKIEKSMQKFDRLEKQLDDRKELRIQLQALGVRMQQDLDRQKKEFDDIMKQAEAARARATGQQPPPKIEK